MIVPVTVSNLNDAAMIHSISWKESHRSFCTPGFIELHTPERQSKYILEKIKNGSAFYMLIDEQPVGIVSVNSSMIEDLYVLPNEQGKGCGTKLVEFAIGKCSQTPTLWILENNIIARKLYLKLGFKETGNIKSAKNKLSEIEFKLI